MFKTISFALLSALFFSSSCLLAAPYADIVIDADTYEVLSEQDPEMQLHPAGLTKLITLYATFAAIRAGEISMDDKMLVSAKAAAEPPVKLGLKAGSKIEVRYLLRAVAVAGANDASTVLGEGLAGSEHAFERRLSKTSEELGLTRSTWRNAHGLTVSGHMSTAKDIARLMLAHRRDFPQYFNLFSRLVTDAGVKKVSNSSRRILGNVKGVSAARFGHTRAAGYSAAIYVTRNDKSIVVVVLGAQSSRSLLTRLMELADAHT